MDLTQFRGNEISGIGALFKCAVQDDDTLVDAIVEKRYGIMKDLTPAREANGRATCGSRHDSRIKV